MKWQELTLKERKQIYDTIRAENPNASYLDIKAVFDAPAYEGGKNKKVNPPVELGLTPGTPEYFARQQRISGKADVVQPEVHLTPAGYVKDAMSFAENVAEGNLDPQESKSHMLHLKRAMLQHGKLNGWSDDLTQEQIEDFLNDARNRVNSMNKIQYDMYRNKSRFVDRMNNLIPMEFAVPLSVSGLLNYNNKEQSN